MRAILTGLGILLIMIAIIAFWWLFCGTDPLDRRGDSDDDYPGL